MNVVRRKASGNINTIMKTRRMTNINKRTIINNSLKRGEITDISVQVPSNYPMSLWLGLKL
eukprot:7762535-Karenia_brevis.AAC.1